MLDAEQMTAWVTVQEGVRNCPGASRGKWGWEGQAGAARAGLVSSRGCDGREKALL